MTTQPPDRLFRPVSSAAQAKGERVFCTAVALLLVLSEVFSSNIQNTLPTFSHVCRIALTVTAAVLLVAKSLLLTQWQTKQQALTAAALAAFAVFTTAYGHDQWFLFAVLLGIGAKDVDLRRVLQVYLAAAAGGLLAVQLLHAATPLVPYLYYCRNWDYGYGHYNGYGARLAGVFLPGAGCVGRACAGGTGAAWLPWQPTRCWCPAAAGLALPWYCCWFCFCCSVPCPPFLKAASGTAWPWLPHRWRWGSACWPGGCLTRIIPPPPRCWTN